MREKEFVLGFGTMGAGIAQVCTQAGCEVVVLEPDDAPLEAGRPSGEPAAAWRDRVVRRGMTANDVWGGKLMWGHVEDLLARARALDGLAAADLQTALRALLGDVRLVFVTRSDKVAQAVSLWRAVQTQRWRADADVPRRPHDAEYRFAAINHLISQLQADDAAWRAWFATHAPSAPQTPVSS